MSNNEYKIELIFSQEDKKDISVYEKIFKLFYPSMCQLSQSYVEDEDIAKDIAQEVFVRLWKKRDQYQKIPSIKSFLYKMVKNASLNYIRDQKIRTGHIQQIGKDSDLFSRNIEIEEETYRLLAEAVNNLPSRSAQIIRLTMKGLKNVEIAEELDISVNTVKTLKYNALKELKKVLKGRLFIILLIKLWL